MDICDYVGIVSKYLALNGLSWRYVCHKIHDDEECMGSNLSDDIVDNDTLIGEGSFIIFIAGFEDKKLRHGRVSFVKEDDGEIVMISSYGTQGAGEHIRKPMISFPSEEQVKNFVEEMAKYLISNLGELIV